MDIQITAKDIQYRFNADQFGDVLETARKHAMTTTQMRYEDEREFENEEYEELLGEGKINNYEEYCEFVGIDPSGADYRKPFEENINHPEIVKQIEDFTNKYMCNYLDLPKNAVVTIDDSTLDEKHRPDEAVVRHALKEKFGVEVVGYATAAQAEKKDIVAQNSYERVGEMFKTKDFQTFLELRASLNKYSSKNISLLYAQKPDAKMVQGFHAWKDYNRHVDAGQKGLSVWTPMKKELRNEKQVDAYIKANEYEYGKPDSSKALKAKKEFMDEISQYGKATVVFGFGLGTVFDVSQTVSNDPENDKLDELINCNKPLDKDMSNYNEVVQAMHTVALIPFADSICSSQQDSIFNSVMGYTDTLLNTPELIKGVKSRDKLGGIMDDIASGMSAYLICSHLGIDCGEQVCIKIATALDYNTDQQYLIGQREIFTKAFDRACSLSDQFNKDFDKEFGYDLEAERNKLKGNQQKNTRKVNDKMQWGKSTLTKIDEWEKDGTTYTIGQVDATGNYCIKMVDENKKASYLRDDDGTPMKFSTQPSRADVEEWATPLSKSEVNKPKNKDTISME